MLDPHIDPLDIRPRIKNDFRWRKKKIGKKKTRSCLNLVFFFFFFFVSDRPGLLY